jgi:hypothetical protein
MMHVGTLSRGWRGLFRPRAWSAGPDGVLTICRASNRVDSHVT